MSKYGEWISVDDRLPPRDEQVLLCGDTSTGIGIMELGVRWTDGDFTTHRHGELHGYFEKHEGGVDFETNITHWMPLPEPPSRNTTQHKHNPLTGRCDVCNNMADVCGSYSGPCNTSRNQTNTPVEKE